jgi:hypothetical protein
MLDSRAQLGEACNLASPLGVPAVPARSSGAGEGEAARLDRCSLTGLFGARIKPEAYHTANAGSGGTFTEIILPAASLGRWIQLAHPQSA